MTVHAESDPTAYLTEVLTHRPNEVQVVEVQAGTSLKRKYTTGAGVGNLILPGILLVVLWFIRDADFSDGLVAASGYVFSGFLAFGVVAAAVMGVAGELQTEREDGTLLRAKAVPRGMTGHLVAKLFSTPVDARIPVVPGLLRRMARRQSGPVVAAARERVLNRGY